MFFKLFGLEIKTFESYFDLGKYSKKCLITLKNTKLEFELR
jgi:hypothetical protein